MSTELILTNLPTETLAEMAAEKAALVEQHGRKTVQAAIDCGRYLTEIKSRLGHGEWLPWLEKHWEWSQPTAFRYIHMAANYSRVNNLEEASSIREALRMISEVDDAAGTKRTRKAPAEPAPEVEVIDNRPTSPRAHDATNATAEADDDEEKHTLPPVATRAHDATEPPPLPKTNTHHTPATQQRIDRGPDPAPPQTIEDAYGMPLLEVVISNHTTQEVVDALIVGLQGPQAQKVAAILRKAADKLDPQPVVAKEQPAKRGPAAKHPTTAQLQEAAAAYDDAWPGQLITQVRNWASYKQSLAGNAKVRSLQSWAAALTRIDHVQKMRGAGTVCEMISKAIANGWQGWEHDSSSNGRPTVASTRIDSGEDYSDLEYRTV